MPKVVKIAVSIPEDEFAEMEASRKSEDMSRSKLIREAFKFWRDEKKRAGLARQYCDGYGWIPEKISEAKIWEEAVLDVISEGEW